MASEAIGVEVIVKMIRGASSNLDRGAILNKFHRFRQSANFPAGTALHR